MVGVHSTTSPTTSKSSDVVVKDDDHQQKKKQFPVQVYVRIRPLIQEEKGHTEMEYKIIGTPQPTTSTTNPTTATVVVDNNRNENEADDELHIKIPGKKRTMNPAFQQAHLSQRQGSNSSSSDGAAVVFVQQQPPQPPKRFQRLQSRDKWKVFNGITNVIDQNNTNQRVYNKTIQPVLLQSVLSSSLSGDAHDAVDTNQPSPPSTKPTTTSLCVFTYGHTGSGKSHTLLGYDDNENNLGIYKYAIRDVFQRLESLNDKGSDDEKEHKPLIVLIRITELYKDKIRDLLTGDDCTVRENKQGVANIRGPLIECPENGMIDQKPLGRLCTTQQEAIQCIDDACQNRRVGTSTHHDQSSRSHLVFEIEICTQELVEQRNLVVRNETHLTRLMWLQTERMFGKHIDRVMPKWTEDYTSGAMKLRHEITQYEKLVKASQNRLKDIESSHFMLGTTIVFCDLAGNEYAKDSTGSTKEEMEEAATINKSLLSVKEMIRTLNDQSQKHVNYRDSKLSMLLKRHFVQQPDGGPTKKQPRVGSSKGGRQQQQKGTSATGIHQHNSYAIMMGHISPSSQYIRKTLNTLTYCQMVGHTNKTKKTSTTGRGGGIAKRKATVVTSNTTSNRNDKKIEHLDVEKAAAVTAAVTAGGGENPTSTTTTSSISNHDEKKNDGKENQP